jgi:hypothetical protein
LLLEAQAHRGLSLPKEGLPSASPSLTILAHQTTERTFLVETKAARQISIERKSKAGALRMDGDINSSGSEFFAGAINDERRSFGINTGSFRVPCPLYID